MGVNDTPGSPFGLLFSEDGAGDDVQAWSAASGDSPFALTVPEDVKIIREMGPRLRAFARRSGGMGEVFLCVARQGPRHPIALKSFRRSRAFDAVARRAFERECAVALRLAYLPGIHPVLGIEKIDGRPFMLMPGVLAGPDGVVNLRDVIERGPIPAAAVCLYASWIAQALELAGAVVPGLVHGDLKPENLLMEYGLPQVTDFGLARVARESLGGDILLTTPAYAAPELRDTGAPLTVAGDIYAYGIIVRELLDQVTDDLRLRTALNAVAERCTAIDPGDRPADFAEVRVALPRDFQIPMQLLASVEAQFELSPILRAAHYQQMVGALIGIGRFDHALSLIEQMDEESLHAPMWSLKAGALSRLKRHEEALECFNRALNSPERPPPREEVWDIRHERALCLKRLQRHEEACGEFEHLAAVADTPHQMWLAIGNLGAVCVDAGYYDEAERLLQMVISQADHVGPSHANLAVLYAQRGEFERAAEQWREAILREPTNGSFHQQLGELLFTRLGQVPEAADEFLSALSCGRVATQLHVRCLACALLLRDEELRTKIDDDAQRTFGEDEAHLIHYDALVLVAVYLRKFGRPDLELENSLPDGWNGDVQRFIADLESDLEPPRERPQALMAPLSRRMQVERSREGFLTFDFYLPFSSLGYRELFTINYRVAITVQAAEVKAYFRASPVLLTRCRHCDANIATNRTAGTRFTCRTCGHLTIADPDPSLEELRTLLDASISAEASDDDASNEEVANNQCDTDTSNTAYMVIAICQPEVDLSEAQLLAMHFAARQCGMEPLLGGHSGLVYAISHVVKNGTFEGFRPVFGALRRYAPGEYRPSMGTPEDVDEYFITVRAVAQLIPIRRQSISIPSTGDYLDLLAQGRDKAAERLLDANAEGPTDAPRWVSLAIVSLTIMDHTAADRRITRALAADDRYVPAWVSLGQLRLNQGRLQEAMEAASHAFRLDEGNGNAAALLARLYRLTGDENGARYMAWRAGLVGVRIAPE